ncbi:caspase family protein [Streptomyces sp. NPDC052236]|uniref:caspase family protein n=1 Tax=Streptomyces sp. NPDC052236 TaxID=3365686 RepID=UPI0037D567E2
MRYLIAAGTRYYLEDPELPRVHDDVKGVVALFESMGYERVLASVSHDPECADFENALSDWCRSPELAADDVVVVYYAGHGSRSPSSQYRLACADTRSSRPRSWLSLPNLAEVLATSSVRNVLFIVDSCHAAAAGTEISTVTDTIVASRGRSDAFGAGTGLLASARHRDTAVDGAFVTELARACQKGDGPSQRYLAPSTVADRVNRSFVASGLRQRAACSFIDQSEPPPFFMNPSFDPHAEIAVDGRICADASDLSSHFEPRGRGVEHVHDPGSYFTGRERALLEARAHLAKEGNGGILVVTADPGSGKSAVLGRLVLEGCADASVNARHQTLEALVGRLAAAADVRAAAPGALFSALADRQRPFRVVVDSLDEAGAGGDKAEARRIAWELLRPLAGVMCVRLVVGSRRELLPHTGDRVPVIDLDDSAYADDTDTAEYVVKIISDTGAPYEHSSDIAHRVAAEVARRARRCFLVARMTASALLRGPAIDTSVPGWTEQLPSDVGGAFEAYLQRLSPERYASTTALLTALAFGEGNGLPRKIWIQAATRLSGIALTEAHIDVLLKEDGSYLSQASVDGTKYFRLYHQELTDHIKNRVLKYRDLSDVQECFVDTLLGLVPDQDWSRAHPYVRIHLATHAAGSGALDDLIEDASFIISAEPSTLLPAVRHALRHPPLSMAVERYTYLLLDLDPAAVDRAALLAFVAETYGEHGFARRAERMSSSLERICVETRGITPHRVVGRHDGDAYAVRSRNPNWLIEDVRLPDGSRAVLAAPPWTSHVHVWLLDNPSQSTLLPHPADVVGLALMADRTGRTEAITLDAEGTLRMWDVADQTLSRTVPGTGYTFLFGAGLLSDGTPVLVCGNSERVAALSLLTLEPLVEVDCPTLREHRWSDDAGASSCLSHDEAGHVHLLVCDGVRGRVTLHPLEGQDGVVVVLDGLTKPALADHIRGARGTLAAICEPRTRMTLLDTGSMKTVAVPFNGFSWQRRGFAHGSAADPVLVAQDKDDLLVVRFDAPPRRITANGKKIGYADLMVPLLHGEQLYAVAVGFGMDLAVVDCTTGDAVGSPLLGHEGAVCAVHALSAAGADGPDIMAIGNDGTARLWPWGVHEEQLAGIRHSGSDLEFSAPEIELLIPWSRDPAAVMAVSGGLIRRVEPDLSDTAANGMGNCLVHGVLLGGSPMEDEEEHLVEDLDGTLNVLSWEYTGHVEPKVLSDRARWPSSVPVSFCIWHRLRPDVSHENSSLTWLHGDSDRMRGQLLPPTRSHPWTRFAGFDAVCGRVRLLNSPEDTGDWVDLPWTVDPSDDFVCATAFTTLSGDTVLMTGARPIRGWESSVGGRTSPSWDMPTPRDEAATIGRVWDVSTGAPHPSDGLELAHDLWLLVPHHGDTGTHWVAQRGRDGATSAIDLLTYRQYAVSPACRSMNRRGGTYDSLVAGRAYVPRWAKLRDGTPVLLCLAPDTYDASHLAPVAVWDATAPDSPRRLPLLASHILWTGSAPSGEALVAVSDEHGVALCHLPSCEKVWSTPLPALVTSITALPESPYLDLAVGTQQGVVFLRPQLSTVWRERLGVG